MLISPVKEINDLRLARVTSRPTVCTKILLINGMIVARLPGGRFWCSWNKFSQFAYTPGHWNGRTFSLLTGLHRLSLITTDAMNRHLAIVREQICAHELRTDERELKSLSEKYRFKAPKLKVQKKK